MHYGFAVFLGIFILLLCGTGVSAQDDALVVGDKVFKATQEEYLDMEYSTDFDRSLVKPMQEELGPEWEIADWETLQDLFGGTKEKTRVLADFLEDQGDVWIIRGGEKFDRDGFPDTRCFFATSDRPDYFKRDKLPGGEVFLGSAFNKEKSVLAVKERGEDYVAEDDDSKEFLEVEMGKVTSGDDHLIETYNYAEGDEDAYFMVRVHNTGNEHINVEFKMNHTIQNLLPASEMKTGDIGRAAWDLTVEGGVIVAEEVFPPVISTMEALREFHEELGKEDVGTDSFELSSVPAGHSLAFFLWTQGEEDLEVERRVKKSETIGEAPAESRRQP